MRRCRGLRGERGSPGQAPPDTLPDTPCLRSICPAGVRTEDEKLRHGQGIRLAQRHWEKSRVNQEQSTGLGDPVTRQRSLITAWLWLGFESEIQAYVLQHQASAGDSGSGAQTLPGTALCPTTKCFAEEVWARAEALSPQLLSRAHSARAAPAARSTPARSTLTPQGSPRRSADNTCLPTPPLPVLSPSSP